ncbi:MAG: PIG-L family deacetylase [Verrucomicrobiota bacterium]
MKRGQKSRVEADGSLLVFGAHPDDIEFGCGGVVALETASGRRAHFVVCSRGEAGSRGTPNQRVREARAGARRLGATIEFLELDGDSRLEIRSEHILAVAALIRRHRPRMVLAPSLVENQHPDHARLGRIVRDACRVARYGGVKELRRQEPHRLGQLYYYAVTPEAEPAEELGIYVDISAPEILSAWVESMEAHASQTAAKSYVELQLGRARVRGLRAGVGHAMVLFPNDPPVIGSLGRLDGSARQF